MMRILFSAQFFLNHLGGAELCAQTLVKRLAIKHEVLALSSGKKGNFTWEGVRVVQNDLPNNIPAINLLWESSLKKLDFEPDLVMTQGNAGASTVFWAGKNGIPSVFHIRSLDHISLDYKLRSDMDNLQKPNFKSPTELLRYPAYRMIYIRNAKAMREANLTICQSRFMAGLVERYTGSKPHVLPMIIDLEASKSAERGSGVLAVGLQRHKGGELISKVAKALPQYMFEICGRIDDRYLWVKKLPNVRLHGEIGDMGDFYGLGRLLLAPYPESENFPRTVIEAGANGIPSLCLGPGGTCEAAGQGSRILAEDELQWVYWTDSLMRGEGYEILSKKAVENAKEYSLQRSLSALNKLVKSELGLELF